LVVDGSRPLYADARAVLEQTRERAHVVLFNKRDLGTAGYDARDGAERGAIAGSVIASSVYTEATLEDVRREIARAGWHGETVDLARPHLASARQADAVARAREALDHARATLAAAEPVDLVAPELLAATAALGEITGAAATEAMLDGIFARFCIGK
jgi:tRNA U34 5-carboxymethylaminomethyl modifying GTPase MnmE/TrmE